MSVLSRIRNQRTSAVRRAGRANGRLAPLADPTPLAEDTFQRAFQCQRLGMLAAPEARASGDPGARELAEEARHEIERRFRLVPDGYAALPQTLRDDPGCPEIDVDVDSYLLAVHPVTNAEFQWFVDAGGYTELELWPRDLWEQLGSLCDSTGVQAPRYWRHGRYERHLADHPVVGVSYYEAAAYARWAGYRLPTESEWQMAATWRVRSAAYIARRYPWGEAIDTSRCNVWATGIHNTVAVSDFAGGAAPNGVQQLIGNVWEWTASDYDVTDDKDRPVIGEAPLKSVRGGAFDTYFPAQATSSFRTGLAAVVRARNVGFRCALGPGVLNGGRHR